MQKSTDNHSSGADRELKLFTARQYIPQDLPISVTRGRHTIREYPPGNELISRREFWKIAYIFEGSGILRINDIRHHLRPGYLYLCHPDDEMAYELVEPIRLYQILFKRECIAGELAGLYHAYNFFDLFSPGFVPKDSSLHEQLHVFNTNRNIYALIRRMAHEYDYHDANTGEMLKHQLLELLIELARLSTRSFVRKRREEISGIVYDYLCRNYRQPISMQKVANGIGLSRGRLLTLYHQQTGRTIGKTLLDIRLNEAKRRLSESDGDSIERICYLSGFTDLANFYKYFRRETGMTPGDYRGTVRRSGADKPEINDGA